MVDPESHMANWIDRHSVIEMVKLSNLSTPKRCRIWIIQAKSTLPEVKWEGQKTYFI